MQTIEWKTFIPTLILDSHKVDLNGTGIFSVDCINTVGLYNIRKTGTRAPHNMRVMYTVHCAVYCINV